MKEEELLRELQDLRNQLELERSKRDALNTALSISLRLAADIRTVFLKSEALSITLTYEEFYLMPFERNGDSHLWIRTPHFYYKIEGLNKAFYEKIAGEMQSRASLIELDRLIMDEKGNFIPFKFRKFSVLMDEAEDGLYF